MTMASGAVGPEVTDEANPGPEGSSTCGRQVDGCCRGSLVCSGLAHGTLSLRLDDAPDFSCIGSSGDVGVPSRTVQGKRLPCVGVDNQPIEGRFEAAFVSLLLPSD